MKKFITITIYAFVINALVIDVINMTLDHPLTEIEVVAWGVGSSLIGVGLAYAIRYAIKLAKEHQV